MGLAIAAYSHLVPAPRRHEYRDGCADTGHVYAFAYDTFPESFRGLTITARKRGLLVAGCMTRTDRTVTRRFDAGSYSGYGRWRTHLADRFNPDRDPARPFGELIWFADNEGTIGPDAAADLARDFVDHRDAYRADADPGHVRLYDDFATAAALAADGGLIEFR